MKNRLLKPALANLLLCFTGLFFSTGPTAQVATVGNIFRECLGNTYDLQFTITGAPIFYVTPDPPNIVLSFVGYKVTAPQPYGTIKEDCFNALYYNPGAQCDPGGSVCACNGVTYYGPECAENAGFPEYSSGECVGGELVFYTIHNIPSGSGVTITIQSNYGFAGNGGGPVYTDMYTFPPYSCTPPCQSISATASSNSPVCTGATLGLQSSATNAVSWQWTGPGGYSSTQQNPTRTNASTSFSGTYRVTVTDNMGCTGTASTQATVLPAVQIGNISTSNLTGTFTLTGGQPQINGSNYSAVTMSLQGNPGITATLTTAPFTHNETVNFTAPQAGTYTIVATDAAGCSGSATVTLSGPAPCNKPGTPSLTKSGHSFLDISWSDPNPGTNYAYEVQYRETNGAWQSLLLAPYTPGGYCDNNFPLPIIDPQARTRIRGLKPCTNYEVQVRKICNFFPPGTSTTAWSNSSFFNTKECGNAYFTANCHPVARYGDYITVSQFNLAGMADTIGYCLNCGGCFSHNDGYQFRANLPVTLLPNQVYPLSFTVETGSDSTDGYLQVWLDLNRDLDFNDPGELLLNQYVTANSPQAFPVSIPAGITVGVSRLRVVLNTENAPSPCNVLDYGMVRDYPVNLGNFSCPPMPVSASANTPLCAGDNLQFQANAPGAVAYQWSGPNNYFATGTTPQLPNAQTVQSGTYTVTATDNLGCTGTATVLATVVPKIQVSNVSIGFPDGSFQISGGLPELNGGTYTSVVMERHSMPNTSATLSGQPFEHLSTVLYSAPEPEGYVVIVTDSLGCIGLGSIDLRLNSLLPTNCPSNDFSAADICSDVCFHCDFNGYIGTTTGYTGQAPSGFCGTVENEQWFAFIAGEPAATFTATPSNCVNNNGLQLALYSNCNGNPLACEPGGEGFGDIPISMFSALTPGGVYYLLVDSYAGDFCDFQISVDPPTAVSVPNIGATGAITGPTTVCQGDTIQYSIPTVSGAGIYVWEAPFDWLINGQSPPVVLFPFGANIASVVVGYNGGQICVQPRNDCNEGIKVCKPITVSSLPPTILPPVTVCNEDLPYELPWGGFVSTSGIYEETYISYQGCDSVVRQQVTALDPKIRFLPPQVICAGDCLEVCGQQFCTAGNYAPVCTSYQGCDSLVNFSLLVLDPVAEIQPANGLVLSCSTPALQLGSAVTPGTKVWKRLNGTILGTGATLNVTEPGAVVLTVTATGGGTFCLKNDTVVITGSTTPPTISATGGVMNCTGAPVQLTSSTNATNPLYSWAPASGLSATNVANPLALVPGTYTVVVTDANGCTAVATAVVTGSAPPALSTTASPSNCNQSEGSINLTVQGGTPGYTFSWSNGGSQEDLQNLPPGTYTVTVTDAAGCSATASATVNVIGLTAGFTTVVLGDVVSFTNSSVNATSFSWTFGDGDGSTQTNPTHTYAADGTYTVTLTALNACGSSTFSQMVTIVTPPVAGFSVSDSTGCVPFSVQYTSAASANTVTYKWLFPGGSPASSTVANPAVSYAVPGVYSATLIAGNAAGADTFTVMNLITATELIPSVGFTYAVNSLTVSFSNTSMNGTSYSWSFGDGQTSTLQNPVHSYALPGTYTVELTIMNPCGVSTVQQMVIVNDIPLCSTSNWLSLISNDCGDLLMSAGTAPGDPTIYCEGQTVSILNNTTPIAGIQTTIIDWGDGNCEVFNGAPGVLTHSYMVADTCTNNGIQTFQVQLGALWPCSGGLLSFNYVVFPVAVRLNPIAKFSIGPVASCSTTTVGLTNESCPNDPIASYVWDFSDGSFSGLKDPGAHNYNSPGTYTITLHVANSCTTTSYMQTVLVGTTLQLETNITAPSCQGQNTGSATVTTSGGVPPYSYLWSNGQTGSTAQNLAAGTYTVTVTDAVNCTASATATVPESAPLAYTNFITQCRPGDTTYLVALRLTGGTPPYSLATTGGFLIADMFASLEIPSGTPYSFTFNDAGNCGPLTVEGVVNCNCEIFFDTTVCAGSAVVIGGQTYSIEGDYSIAIPGNAGCDTLLHLNLRIDQPDLLINGKTVVCPGGTTQLTAQSPQCPSCSFAWSTAGANMPTITVTPSAPGTNYSVTVTNDQGCTASSSVYVRVYDEKRNLNAVICAGDDYEVCGHFFDTPGQYQVTCTSYAGCDSTVILSLAVEKPHLGAVSDTVFFPAGTGLSEKIFPITENDGLGGSNSWQIQVLDQPQAGQAGSTPDGKNLLFRLTDPAFRGVDVLRYRLCNPYCPNPCSEATVWIVIQEDPAQIAKYLPNTITPNGDNYNDEFDPLGFINSQGFNIPRSRASLTILNRWGEGLFHADSYQPWDGKANGKQVVPQGTYYYIFRLELDEPIEIKGPINVFGTNE
ncbi:MAG: PKD domain-containing protein [Saprospiraceae bacterium]|nr:PKD domain-containing protein [Saprospiraceae bacterium]